MRTSAFTLNKDHESISSSLVKAVVIAGGTGFRDITRALIQEGVLVTRIVPPTDNGGSSRVLREAFEMVPIGDIRHSLMSMAEATTDSPRGIIRLFNWRLPIDADDSTLRNQLEEIISKKHVLMKNIPIQLQEVISTFLDLFRKNMNNYETIKNKKFDLRNANIGNLVLAGAYFAFSKNLNPAIYVFKELCKIKGDVWPTALDGRIHLGAELADKIVIGETEISRDWREGYPIRDLFLVRKENQDNDLLNRRPINRVFVQPNPNVIDAISKADVIVYGPGSFFTSILNHLLIDDIAKAIAEVQIPKIFIGNMIEDYETKKLNLEKMIDIFLNTAMSKCKDIDQKGFLTNIIGNIPIDTSYIYSENKRYLQMGDVDKFKKMGISVKKGDFESPWQKGCYDPLVIAKEIYICAKAFMRNN
jgi:CofD-related protein of GAK system